MQDGAELGRALAAHPGNTEAGLAAHEQAMFARAAMEADDDGFYTIMIDDHAPHSLLALRNGVEQDVGERPGPLSLGIWSARRRTSAATARV
ncbi:hypothetical protein [Streptomyces caniferus]|uniref:hypothetical protein n=1 Tax=Streptomyces caniferus TaxID=285557 RepID=UPI003F4D2191